MISAFTWGSVTIKNLGPGPAGPFRLRAGDATRTVVQSFAGLAAGASETRALTGLMCTATYVALVDDLEQVAEADEANDTKGSEGAIC